MTQFKSVYFKTFFEILNVSKISETTTWLALSAKNLRLSPADFPKKTLLQDLFDIFDQKVPKMTLFGYFLVSEK